ncbi:ribonuclease 8-like [Lepus europaeus]|uniref:ribonuclease 8-like n=1 Tax=Lepus europaeus TaxID=9983 RepID=UPI002B4A692E|nr:ribonuclease 8-like [Lepus europaeus]
MLVLQARALTHCTTAPAPCNELLIPAKFQGKMAPAKTEFRSLMLLLLLGLWVAEYPVTAKPKDMTSAQWFETQHVQPTPQSCNSAMSRINQYTKQCKNLNTFLHEPFTSVIPTCDTPNVACKNGRNNCHQSPGPVSMTNCQHVSGSYPDCKYKQTEKYASFIVACDPPQAKDDSSYPLLPVHFDKVV